MRDGNTPNMKTTAGRDLVFELPMRDGNFLSEGRKLPEGAGF